MVCVYPIVDVIQVALEGGKEGRREWQEGEGKGRKGVGGKEGRIEGQKVALKDALYVTYKDIFFTVSGSFIISLCLVFILLWVPAIKITEEP